jgi:hypothetical protein
MSRQSAAATWRHGGQSILFSKKRSNRHIFRYRLPYPAHFPLGNVAPWSMASSLAKPHLSAFKGRELSSQFRNAMPFYVA